MMTELIRNNRSYRRFDQSHAIAKETLVELVNLARLSASAKNLQPLKYIISHEPQRNAIVFDSLAWAAYLPDWTGPKEGERPTGYIIVLGDKSISTEYDVDPGIVMQSMLLGAVEKGLGGCMFGSVQRAKLRKSLNIADQYEILYVVALGAPIEEVVIEDVNESDNIKYWRDENQVHHVPKRRLADLIINV